MAEEFNLVGTNLYNLPTKRSLDQTYSSSSVINNSNNGTSGIGLVWPTETVDINKTSSLVVKPENNFRTIFQENLITNSPYDNTILYGSPSSMLLPGMSVSNHPQIPPLLRTSTTSPLWSPLVTDVGSSFSPSWQTQVAPKHNLSLSDDREPNSLMKKSDGSSKRPRNETTPPLPKVKKEKIGDRITTLQQLVSPFGKTDAASVLSETIEYIKFLHDQVTVLSSSTPHIKREASLQQISNNCKYPKQDLQSRGLTVVPTSYATSMDFWASAYGGIQKKFKF